MIRTLRWLAIVFAGACGAAPAAPDASEPLAVVRLRPEPVPLTYTSGLSEPQELVVRDAAAWAQVWEAIWRNHSPRPPLPDVDFAKEMVVVAALGARPTGGYSVFVDSASSAPGAVSIRIRTVSPGRECAVTLAVTQPVDAARVARRDGPVVFSRRNEVADCRLE